jgi:uncharacterized membrane protein
MKRFWEIDAARGCAIIAMIVFHTLYILSFLQMIELDLFSGFFWVFPRCIAGSFLLIAGISLTLSYHRVKHTKTGADIIKKYLVRGLLILILGLAITIVSYLALGPERVVLFGILHLIGAAIIIAIPLISFTYVNLILGLAVFTTGIALGIYRFGFFWLLWLGFRPAGYYPVDYLPLLPWFSFVLFGLFAGNLLYRKNKRIFPLPDISNLLPIRLLQILGRFSIYIYLAHLPLIYAALSGIKILLMR